MLEHHGSYAAKFGPKFLVRSPFENWEHVDMAPCVALWNRVAKLNTFCIPILHKSEYCEEGSSCMQGCTVNKNVIYYIWILWYSVRHLFWNFSILCVAKTYLKACIFKYSWNIYLVYVYMITIFMSQLKRAFCCHTCHGLCDSVLQVFRLSVMRCMEDSFLPYKSIGCTIRTTKQPCLLGCLGLLWFTLVGKCRVTAWIVKRLPCLEKFLLIDNMTCQSTEGRSIELQGSVSHLLEGTRLTVTCTDESVGTKW